MENLLPYTTTGILALTAFLAATGGLALSVNVLVDWGDYGWWARCAAVLGFVAAGLVLACTLGYVILEGGSL